MLSTALIYARRVYFKRYDREGKEKNILIIDDIIFEAFDKMIYKTLNYHDINGQIDKL
jgi:hypothetical protein